MHWVKYSKTAPGGRDVNLPETLAHRSVEGDTLLLVPGANYELTDEEWAFLEREHKDLLAHFQPLGG